MLSDVCESGQTGAHVAVVDPLHHAGWDGLLAAHPGATFFHRAAWVRVLRETYGHVPLYFCRFRGGRLEEMLAVAEVSSPWTGRRGVSLPFTDCCMALSSGPEGGRQLYAEAMAHGRGRGWRYLECRGHDGRWPNSSPSLAFYGHVVELEGVEDRLFRRLEGAVRRGIRKAENAGLQIEFTDTLESVHAYYALHCQTRRRHGVPPQPFRFFENIARYVLREGFGQVALVRLADRPIAAGVFFHHARQAFYKFGASDYRFQQWRPNNLLMWGTIRRYAAAGFTSLHLGRTSLANEGLRRFKLGLGAREERIEYLKYDFRRQAFVTDIDRAEGWLNHLFRCLPAPLLRLAGRMLYPHVA